MGEILVFLEMMVKVGLFLKFLHVFAIFYQMTLPHSKEEFWSKYKFSNKKDKVIAWSYFQKECCGMSTYDKLNPKPQISSIFHFYQASDSRIVPIVGVNQ